MTHHRLAIAFIGLSCCYFSCQSGASGHDTGSISAAAVSVQDTPVKAPRPSPVITSLDSTTLLARLFSPGHVTHTNEIAWTPAADEADSFPVSPDGKCYTRVDTVFYYSKPVDTVMRSFALVLFGTYKKEEGGAYRSCHACGPMMSLAVLRKTNSNQWDVKRFVKQFMYSGSWGTRTEVGLVQYGKNKYALDLSAGDLGQGFLEYWIQYYDFEDGHFIYSREAETISNEAAVVADSAMFSYELKSYFIPSDKPYWNLRITSKGRMPEKGGDKVVPATVTEEFVFNPQQKMYGRVSVVKK